MTATEKPLLLGAVDLGSNSFRVEVGRVVDDQILTESYWKETVRLAAGFDEKGFLTEEAQKRALNALSRFKEKLAGVDPKYIRAVGTQALRVAKNSDEFLPKAEAALGHPIEIIAGREEARLVFSGCAHTLPSSPENGCDLLVDLRHGQAVGTDLIPVDLQVDGGIAAAQTVGGIGEAVHLVDHIHHLLGEGSHGVDVVAGDLDGQAHIQLAGQLLHSADLNGVGKIACTQSITERK